MKIKKKESKPKFNPMKKVRENINLMDRLTEEIENDGGTIFRPTDMGGSLNINTDYLSLPSDLTEVPSKELGKYLNAFTQNKAYMRTLYNWQEMLREDMKRKYYDKYFLIYDDYTRQHPKASEKSKEMICNNHNTVKDSFMDFKDQSLKLSMLGNTIASYEEIIFLISREITRRSGDFFEEKRIDKLR